MCECVSVWCMRRDGARRRPAAAGGRALQSREEGLVFKAHRLLYHSTLGWRVIKKKKKLRGRQSFSHDEKRAMRESFGSREKDTPLVRFVHRDLQCSRSRGRKCSLRLISSLELRLKAGTGHTWTQGWHAPAMVKPVNPSTLGQEWYPTPYTPNPKGCRV